MKYCPRCQSTYTDDTLLFCLQDGSELVAVKENPTTAVWNEAETVVRQPIQPPPATKKSNTALVVFLTALATLILFGAGVGAWFLLRNRGTEVVVNSNVNNSPKPANKNSSNTNANKANISNSPTPTPASNTNSNASGTPPAIDAEKIKSEVADKVDDWKSALESGNLDKHLSGYADRLDYYYKSSNVSLATVRSDKERAFGRFDDFRVKISNLRVTPAVTGEKAVAVFDKEWEFEGDDARNAGKTQSQLQLTKINGAWRITGEKDLKIYYVEK